MCRRNTLWILTGFGLWVIITKEAIRRIERKLVKWYKKIAQGGTFNWANGLW